MGEEEEGGEEEGRMDESWREEGRTGSGVTTALRLGENTAPT